MVPPSARSFTQGIGAWFGRTGSLTALLVGGMLYPWLHIVIPMLLGCCVVIFIAFVSRRYYFVNPHSLSFEYGNYWMQKRLFLFLAILNSGLARKF